MDETYGTYADGECFDIHDDDYADHNTDDDTDDDTDADTNDDTDDDTDDGGRGNRRPLPGGAVHYSPRPRSSPQGTPLGGVRTNFRDLDLVWERERERVNRDALIRPKTPGGVGGLTPTKQLNCLSR